MSNESVSPDESTPNSTAADSTPETTEPRDVDALRKDIVAMIQSIFDPEIPVNIWELGLIYELEVEEQGDVKVVMTLTSPNCPVAGTLPLEVEGKVRAVDGVQDVKLDLTWEPAWTPERMSEAAKLELGFF